MYGSIFEKLRVCLSKSKTLNKLFKCSLCLGFWSGVLVSIVEYTKTESIYNIYYIPFASSCACWLFDSIIDALQELSYYLNQKKVKKILKKS